jgi:hypothetical protein
MRGVVVPKGVFDDPAAHCIDGRYATFGIDQKILPADGTADLRGELRFLAYVHRLPAFLFLPADDRPELCGERDSRQATPRPGPATSAVARRS